MENARSPRTVLDIGMYKCKEKKTKQRTLIYLDTTNLQVVDVTRRLLIRHFYIKLIILAEGLSDLFLKSTLENNYGKYF